ncbi:hypothetical protein JIY74_30560 [Vibrio harveyi]|nr:hypothetical protein [Vibrio harveyi]
MKKFLKIMCLASLSILSAGSIFGIVYHQHDSNLVKREETNIYTNRKGESYEVTK